MSKTHKLIKLGEKAESFYDAVTKVKLSKGTKEKVLKIDMSLVPIDSKIHNALKFGHLVYAEPEEFNPDKWEDKEAAGKEATGNEGEYTKEELVDLAIELGSELSKTKLKKLSLEELTNVVAELQGEEEEEVE